ncbi:hypothetical protein [Pontibacter akesuensis]|uniref:Uncharacterized protein n=1 Tax=Pontibacter akesuensis TaxID=388950 RepID=A0A1I7KX14_9BACT|nr:hypothetical protein [Pontibacter akesuensis]GHA78614.1 hypothetical protein GCM10007389_36040 [Pontibacter akesuensis]SFV02023.1 hypothetical protein SAMN04487941_0060 [Pontibacter akesuensis]
MIPTGMPFLKKLTLLLTVLLCSVLVLGLPVVSQAAVPGDLSVISAVDNDEDVPFAFNAGETTPGDPEGVLQLDKMVFGLLFKAILQQVHPEQSNSTALPLQHQTALRLYSLTSILTKGP